MTPDTTETAPKGAWHERAVRDVERTYDRIAGLPLVVESTSSEQSRLGGAAPMERITTEVRLQGGGHVGVGEDVSYAPDDQRPFPAHLQTLPLAGEYTIASFSQHVAGLTL